MERNYGTEIDKLREEIQNIHSEMTKVKALLLGKTEEKQDNEKKETIGHITKMGKMSPRPEMNAILDQLENSCGENGGSGRITYMGVYASGGRQSTWMSDNVDVDRLLPLIKDGTAEKVLACIGNQARLNILLAILKKPMTVAQLVEEFDFGSTGTVYHHLKPLMAADLVVEDSRNEGKGYYVIQPHRVQGIIMLLAGICDMVDTKYTTGQWEEE